MFEKAINFKQSKQNHLQ